MLEMVINYRGIQGLERNITAIIDQATLKGLNEAGRQGVLLVKERTPIGVTAALHRGIFYKIAGNVRQRVLLIDVKGRAGVYKTYREEGRKPGKQPPSHKIENWLRHTPRGQFFVDAIMRKYKIKDRDRAVRSATFLKARAIGKRGYKGAFMFKKSLPAIKKLSRELVENSITEAIRKLK